MHRDELRERYQSVMARVAAAAERSGRAADDVLVVAVTKAASTDQIRQLLEYGHQDLGENRVQHLIQRVAMTEEFLARHRTLTSPRRVNLPPSVRWHMIGNLQRNKVKQVLPLVKLVHSVDTLRLAEEIQTRAEKAGQEVDVLIQVNASGEKTKGGVPLPVAPHLCDQMQTMFNLRVRGLMTMAPFSDDAKQVRAVFRRTAEVFADMKASGRFGQRMNILSMGMSNDFELAIECGANVVRIGRAIFGEAVSEEDADEEAA